MREHFDNAAKWAGVAVLNGGLTLANATNDGFLFAGVSSAAAAFAGYKALQEYLAGVEELHHQSTKPVASAYGSAQGAAPMVAAPQPGELGPQRFY